MHTQTSTQSWREEDTAQWRRHISVWHLKQNLDYKEIILRDHVFHCHSCNKQISMFESWLARFYFWFQTSVVISFYIHMSAEWWNEKVTKTLLLVDIVHMYWLDRNNNLKSRQHGRTEQEKNSWGNFLRMMDLSLSILFPSQYPIWYPGADVGHYLNWVLVSRHFVCLWPQPYLGRDCYETHQKYQVEIYLTVMVLKSSTKQTKRRFYGVLTSWIQQMWL